MKKLGIYAGTFDPIHEGHISFAEKALEQGLDKVMFLPEPRPRRKQAVKALDHRTAMVQLAVAKDPRFGTILLEQARFTPNETLPVLQSRFAGYKLVLLFGDDVIKHIADWPHIDTIIKNCELLIASRLHDKDELLSTIKTLQKTRNMKLNYKIVHPEKQHISSSQIRLDIKHGLQPAGLDLEIQNYIKRHRLYSSSDDSDS